jgi:DNA-binding NarL/FixJ family response regulator
MKRVLRGRYELLEVVGRGGEGYVVKGIDRQHDRFVALKVRTQAESGDREALLAETRVLLALAPNRGLPVVREDFFYRNAHYMVMDWVEGKTLETLLRERGDPGLPASSVIRYLGHAADALDHLHGHSPVVVHGDVKPANLIRTPEGRIVLVDFGGSPGSGKIATRTATRAYADPGHLIDHAPGPRCDIYGLAMTAVVVLTSALPRDPDFDWSLIPRPASQTLRAALSTDPAKRPATAGDFVERFRQSLEGTHMVPLSRGRSKPPSAKRSRKEPLRAMLVDDHPVWRHAVRAILERDRVARIVAEATSGAEAVDLARSTVPDVILMDLQLPNMSGVEATRAIVAQSASPPKILVLSSSEDEPDVIEAVQAGANGYVVKSASPEDIVDAVLRVGSGEPAFSPQLAELLLAEIRRPVRAEHSPALASAERALLASLAEGKTYRQVARELRTTEDAIRARAKRILAKWQTPGRKPKV